MTCREDGHPGAIKGLEKSQKREHSGNTGQTGLLTMQGLKRSREKQHGWWAERPPMSGRAFVLDSVSCRKPAGHFEEDNFRRYPEETAFFPYDVALNPGKCPTS